MVNGHATLHVGGRRHQWAVPPVRASPVEVVDAVITVEIEELPLSGERVADGRAEVIVEGKVVPG